MNKTEFMQQIEGCTLPESFDQKLLDNAAEMFNKWGKTSHMDEKEHLFKNFGLASKAGDSEAVKKEKEMLRCVCGKMMDSKLNRTDASQIIKSFNRIMGLGTEWVEE